MADATTLAGEIESRLLDISVSGTIYNGPLREKAVNEALAEYTRYRENLNVIETINGDGTREYSLPLSFDQAESKLFKLEFPVGQRPPCFLRAPDDYLLYDDGTEKLILFNQLTPSASQQFRITFSAPYTLATLPGLTTGFSQDEYFVINVGASLVCEWIATYYAETSSSGSIDGDGVDYTAQYEQFRQRAQRFRTLGYSYIGIAMPAGDDGRPLGSDAGSGGGGAATAPSTTVVWQQPRPEGKLISRP